MALLSVALAWVFAKGAPHGELLAGLTTAAGVAFGLHSVTEHLRTSKVTSAAYWAHVTGGQREVHVEREEDPRNSRFGRNAKGRRCCRRSYWRRPGRRGTPLATNAAFGIMASLR